MPIKTHAVLCSECKKHKKLYTNDLFKVTLCKKCLQLLTKNNGINWNFSQ